jgi:hypothetical protein
MPPAAEPKHEQVIAGVVAALAGIVSGPAYWHDTEKAIADPHFHGGHMDKSLNGAKASYIASHDQDEDVSDTPTDYAVRLELDVTAFKKFEPATEEPYRASVPKRGTIQARLAADVKNKLRSDEGLTAVAAAAGISPVRVWIPFAHFAADETLFQGWAVVMLRVVVEYTHGQVGA